MVFSPRAAIADVAIAQAGERAIQAGTTQATTALAGEYDNTVSSTSSTASSSSQLVSNISPAGETVSVTLSAANAAGCGTLAYAAAGTDLVSGTPLTFQVTVPTPVRVQALFSLQETMSSGHDEAFFALADATNTANEFNILDAGYGSNVAGAAPWEPDTPFDQTVTLQPGHVYWFWWLVQLTATDSVTCNGQSGSLQFSTSLTFESGGSDGGTGPAPAPAVPPLGGGALAVLIGVAGTALSRRRSDRG